MKLIHQVILGLVTRWAWRHHPEMTEDFVKRNGHYPCVGLPRTGNEIFLWRKIFDHDPRFTVLSDKLASRRWVAERVPSLAIPDVLWTGMNAAEIPDQVLQQNVVFKANHSWRTNHFVRDGQYDRDALRAMGRKWLATTHGLADGQWGYFNVPRKLFVEREIAAGPDGLEELKLYTFGDRILRIVHISGRFDAMWANIWEISASGELRRSTERAAVAPPAPERPIPAGIHEAITIARHLGREFDHLRVDLLWDGETLWFNELTVYNQSGRFPGAAGTDTKAPFARAWDIRQSAFLQRPPRTGRRAIYAHALKRALDRKPGDQLPPVLAKLVSRDIPSALENSVTKRG